MSLLNKAIASAVTTVVTYYIAKYIQRMLEEKPLHERVDDAKHKVVDLKTRATSKASDAISTMQSRLDELSKKVENLAQESSTD